MATKPVVRYMLLCDDWTLDTENDRRITVIGLITNINSLEDPPYPLLYREFCVLLVLTEGRGEGEARIVCLLEETGEKVFETSGRLTFGVDPLEVIGVPFRIRDILFPRPGLYSVQFWYEGELVEERPMRLR